jgi:P27 family predicted phage terminase small subunit
MARTAVPENVKRNQGKITFKDPVTPECPDYLSDDAKAEWARLAPILAERGLLGRVDRTGFEIYCQLHSLWKLTVEATKNREPVTQGCEGQPKLDPMIRFQGELVDRLIRYLQEFGFTPSSRNKVAAPAENNEASALDEFLSNMAKGREAR